MRLEKTRKALATAEGQYAGLVAVENDPVAFRNAFPLALAAIRRVGSMVDSETTGSRTAAFGEWWKETSQDPLFDLVRRVRDAEFKRGNDTKSTVVRRTIQTAVSVEIAGRFVARQDGEIIAEGELTDDAEPKPPPPEIPQDPGSTVWRFTEGNRDVLPTLREYLDRMRDEIIPTAEGLLDG